MLKVLVLRAKSNNEVRVQSRFQEGFQEGQEGHRKEHLKWLPGFQHLLQPEFPPVSSIAILLLHQEHQGCAHEGCKNEGQEHRAFEGKPGLLIPRPCLLG